MRAGRRPWHLAPHAIVVTSAGRDRDVRRVNPPVGDLCSPARLRRLAGARSFERGEEYALDGRVERLAVAEDSATATVTGAAPYRVTLRRDRAGALIGSCTCPVGAFCKHCVAVGLAVAGEPGSRRDELRAYVASRPRGELVEIVLGAVERDRALRDSLQLDMAVEAGDATEALATAIDDAVFLPNDLRWDEAWAYAERLDAALAALERRMTGGHAAEIVALAECFAAAVAAQLEYVDDSSGAVGSTLARAEALHLGACREAAPDPVALAGRLFELETSTPLFEDALDTYSDLLGDTGRARYAELAEAAWTGGPPSWTLHRRHIPPAALGRDRPSQRQRLRRGDRAAGRAARPAHARRSGGRARGARRRGSRRASP